MITVRRALSPIRLAVPALLALSATAAWGPSITTTTGFVGQADTSIPNAAVLGGYNNPGRSENIHFVTKYQKTDNTWVTETDKWMLTDNLSVVLSPINNPPVKFGSASASDVNGGLGYAQISWF